MNNENGCKWFFASEGPVDNGPTNPSKGTFSSSPDIDVVRESIQNSLDAQYETDKPVFVKFSFSKLYSSEFPAFFYLREHIRASLEAYKDNDRAKEKFPTMLQYLSASGDSGSFVDSIDVLTIGDYNTKGMPYDKAAKSSPFVAFMHAIGVSTSKGENAGGSNGLGKETLYNRSAIKALLISTKTVTGQVVFQGATKLATHKDPDDPANERASAFGFYGKDVKVPITVEEDIPERFRRQDPGTDIHVVGLHQFNKDATRDSIVKAVLNHFWLAVHRGKLVVKVDDVTIDADKLPSLLASNFSDTLDRASIKNYEKWNPRPYYNAVVNAEAKKEKTAFVEQECAILGHVRMFLDWSADNLPKKVVFMRQPRMVIYKAGKPSYPNFAAVFVCDHDSGNRALRCVEPPAHNEWDIKYFEGNDSDKRKYRKGIREVNDFVVQTLDKNFRSESSSNEIIIPGLAELLPDLEKSDDGIPGSVGSGASDGLKPSGKIAHKETAAPVSFIESPDNSHGRPTTDKSSRGMATSLIEDIGVKTNENAGESPVIEVGHESFTGHGGRGGGGGGETHDTPPKTTADKPNAKTLVHVHVLYAPICYNKDGVLLHRLILKPDPEEDVARYKCVNVYIRTGNDNNTQDATEIKRVANLPPGAELNGNEIRGLDVTNNLKLDIQFADTIKHSVKVVAYARV